MWNIFFNKKEKKMTTTTKSATHVPAGTDVVNLSLTITEQAKEINRLQDRVSTLSDEIMLLDMELKKFKANAASDINQLFERVVNANE
jgi:predicted RNase H-like nuclease (RuvC/YqgF family)